MATDHSTLTVQNFAEHFVAGFKTGAFNSFMQAYAERFPHGHVSEAFPAFTDALRRHVGHQEAAEQANGWRPKLPLPSGDGGGADRRMRAPLSEDVDLWLELVEAREVSSDWRLACDDLDGPFGAQVTYQGPRERLVVLGCISGEELAAARFKGYDRTADGRSSRLIESKAGPGRKGVIRVTYRFADLGAATALPGVRLLLPAGSSWTPRLRLVIDNHRGAASTAAD